MILICGSLPLLPKFFQIVTRRENPAINSAQPLRHHNPHRNPRPTGKESGLYGSGPWNEVDGSGSKIANSYMPLEDFGAQHNAQCMSVSGGIQQGAGWRSTRDGDVGKNYILKTVCVESSV